MEKSPPPYEIQPSAPQMTPVAQISAYPVPQTAQAPAGPTSRTVWGIFGGSNLRYQGQVAPREINCYSIMGGATIDLRGAYIQPGTKISGFALMGGIQILADPTVEVDASGTCSICGGFSDERQAIMPSVNPVKITVSQFNVCGGTSVGDIAHY